MSNVGPFEMWKFTETGKYEMRNYSINSGKEVERLERLSVLERRGIRDGKITEKVRPPRTKLQQFIIAECRHSFSPAMPGVSSNGTK